MQPHEERDGCPSQGMQLMRYPCEPRSKTGCDSDQQLDLLYGLNKCAHDLQIMAHSLVYYR